MSALHFRLKSLSKAEMQVRFPGESYTGMPDECRSRVRTYHSKSPVLGLKKYKIKSVIRANRTRRASKSGLHSQSQSLFRRQTLLRQQVRARFWFETDPGATVCLWSLEWIRVSRKTSSQPAWVQRLRQIAQSTEGCYGDELEASYTNRCLYK